MIRVPWPMDRSLAVYGPWPSWRFGRSLGVDMTFGQSKTCSFDCVYCEYGRTVNRLTERREFVPLEVLTRELEACQNAPADCVTFSGRGEPTLASNLGQAIELARSILDLPVVVLTNSSLMFKEDVAEDLARADMVATKVDAPSQELLKEVNRPGAEFHLETIVETIKQFRERYKGKLALQMMFVKANKYSAEEMAKLAREISPHEVQLDTPLRPCAVEPLLPWEMAAIGGAFAGLKVISVYERLRLLSRL